MKNTLSTIKAFCRREAKNGNLWIKKLSAFSGMIDCVESVADNFKKTNFDEKEEYTYGMAGAWFAGRNYIQEYTNNDFIGYEISNCCGSFIVAMKKLYRN